MNCNVEGLNQALQSQVRIGLLGNNEGDCGSPDSGLGFGVRVASGCLPQGGLDLAAGSACPCECDGDVGSVKRFGYVLGAGPPGGWPVWSGLDASSLLTDATKRYDSRSTPVILPDSWWALETSTAHGAPLQVWTMCGSGNFGNYAPQLDPRQMRCGPNPPWVPYAYTGTNFVACAGDGEKGAVIFQKEFVNLFGSPIQARIYGE